MNLTATLLLILIIALHSCTKTSEERQENNVETPNGDLEGCYAFMNNNDSILMHLQFNGKEVTGSLLYNFYEKDGNDGSLLGEVHGDTIFAMYSFESEGVTSSREVAYLKRGNDYVEASEKLRITTEK